MAGRLARVDGSMGKEGCMDELIPIPERGLGMASPEVIIHRKKRGQEASGAIKEAVYMGRLAQYFLAVVVAVAAFTAAPVRTFATVDLAIESARVDPAQGNATTSFTFAAVVKNKGTTQAKIQPGCFRYRLPADPSYSSTDLKNPTPNPYILNPGQTVECKGQPKTGLPTGLVSVEFIVQTDISQSDTDNLNNRYVVQVPVANASGYVGRPELYFSKTPGFSTGKSSAGIGEEVSIYAYIGNRGDGDALVPKGAVLWNVTEGGKIIAEDRRFDQNNYLYKAGSKDDWRWAKLPNLAPGTHNLVLNLDPQNVIQERNESHQPALMTFNIQVPDLTVTMESLAGKTFSTKDAIPLVVTVRNRGYVTASFPQGAHFLYYGAKGFAVNKLILPAPLSLASYGEYKTSLTLSPFTSTPGNYVIEVWADPVNIMRDSNLADNKTSSPVTLSGMINSLKGAIGSTTPSVPINTLPSNTVPKIVPPGGTPVPVPTPGFGR